MQLKTRPGGKWGRWGMALLVLAAVVSTGWYAVFRGGTAPGDSPSGQQAGGAKPAAVAVEVMAPSAGGIARLCQQPGTVEPFQDADLYTKVSGFLIEQNVDIGDLVQEKQVLARIAVPEYEKQVKADTADLARATARVDQMKAAIVTAEADLGAATAVVALAQAEQKSKASYRAYREKQRNRINELVARMAIDAKLADEQEDHYQASLAAESAAGESVGAARQKEAAARARIKQAQADLRYAEAEVESARARLEKSQVFLDYAVIRSPYTGVVTKRNFHPGDFIRSADAGGERIPVLAVERTDKMRVVIQVPERDVPYVECGDPAIVEVDALPGIVFKTRGDEKVAVSRLAAAEDPHTRMMRTEVHLKNPDGKLRRGMFGRVTITLQPGSPKSLRIPSGALVGKATDGKAAVRVVHDGKARIVPVQYGSDNGSEVEVLSGLAPSDRLIIRAAGPVTDGAAVAMTEAKEVRTGH